MVSAVHLFCFECQVRQPLAGLITLVKENILAPLTRVSNLKKFGRRRRRKRRVICVAGMGWKDGSMCKGK